MKVLHWLPICQRIQHKALTIVYWCIHGNAPTYLKDLFQEHIPRRRGLHSGGTKLVVPCTARKTFAQRSFSVKGPILWNQLPSYLQDSDNLDTFKKNLRTYLFCQEYGSSAWIVSPVLRTSHHTTPLDGCIILLSNSFYVNSRYF